MYNFSEFCKEKKCTHYREWSVQAGKSGMVRCCNLVGMSFYIVKFPDNCIHLKEITERQEYEKEKHDVWQKLNNIKLRAGEVLVFDVGQNKWVGRNPKDVL